MHNTHNHTEGSTGTSGLEYLSVKELLQYIHTEDQKITHAVQKVIPLMTDFIEHSLERIARGGRIFYLGAGTSGRLGVLDASEILPTYGVEGLFIGIIAGGDTALRRPVENAEDNTVQGWLDMLAFEPQQDDIVIGITASGTTPYVLGALAEARNHNMLTAGITCNENTPLSEACDFCLQAITGPEFVRGSTRMKAGTATKMMLNMISTSIMIRLGKVKGDRMVDMQLSNKKLLNRGILMVVDETGLSWDAAEALLLEHKNVRKAIQAFQNNNS
jgi:N-acetylmuramic acid 6-phosphate etherase